MRDNLKILIFIIYIFLCKKITTSPIVYYLYEYIEFVLKNHQIKSTLYYVLYEISTKGSLLRPYTSTYN